MEMTGLPGRIDILPQTKAGVSRSCAKKKQQTGRGAAQLRAAKCRGREFAQAPQGDAGPMFFPCRAQSRSAFRFKEAAKVDPSGEEGNKIVRRVARTKDGFELVENLFIGLVQRLHERE